MYTYIMVSYANKLSELQHRIEETKMEMAKNHYHFLEVERINEDKAILIFQK